MTCRGLILFGAAIIGVPIATVVFLAGSASGADESLVRVWLPAGILDGFAFGLLLDVAVVSLWRKDSAVRKRVRAAFAASS